MAHRGWLALITGLATGGFLLSMAAVVSLVAAVPLAVGGACLVALIVLQPAPGSAVTWLAIAPGTASLAATVVVIARGRDLPRADGIHGLVEVAILCLLLAGIVRWLRGVRLWSCACVTAIAAAAWIVRFLPDRDPGPLLAGVALWSIPAVGAVVVGGYPRLAETRLRNSVASARDQQRAALERDLHDYVAHDVTGMVVQAQAARFAAAEDPDRLREALQRIEESGLRAMTSMDRAIELLRDERRGVDDAAGRPGLDQVGQLIAAYQGTAPGTVQLDVQGDLSLLPREVSESLHRLCVEALTNVRRHATAATAVQVSVVVEPTRATVEITDDGQASSAIRWPRTRGGSGLRTARARIEALGGALTAGPLVGGVTPGGWRVSAVLPLRPTH